MFGSPKPKNKRTTPTFAKIHSQVRTWPFLLVFFLMIRVASGYLGNLKQAVFKQYCITLCNSCVAHDH